MLLIFKILILACLFVSGGCSAFRSAEKNAAIEQTKTVESIRAIGTAVEAYKLNHQKYPIGTSGHLEEIELVLAEYLTDLNSYRSDGWGNEIEYYCLKDGGPYYIISLGADKERDVGLYKTDRLPSGLGFDIITDLRNDIIFSNGVFVRYPKGLQVASKTGG